MIGRWEEQLRLGVHYSERYLLALIVFHDLNMAAIANHASILSAEYEEEADFSNMKLR